MPGLTPYNKSVYYNWGTDPVTNKTAPATRASTCATASFDLAAGGAWGWNDTRCADPYIFVCRVRYPCSVTPPPYTASTQATFQYFPCNLTFDKAELQCNTVGGHLAGYVAEAEQREVEKVRVQKGDRQADSRQGMRVDAPPSAPGSRLADRLPLPPQWNIGNSYLFQRNRTFYWLGVRANVSKVTSPSPEYFNLLDPTLPYMHNTSIGYMHWGLNPGSPDNAVPDELCAGADFTQSYSDAAGWDDKQCSGSREFMCRMMPSGPATCYNASTGNTFCLNTAPMAPEAAEAYCQTLGGHLPSYSSQQEQVVGYPLGAHSPDAAKRRPYVLCAAAKQEQAPPRRPLPAAG
jgi:hypothetical protein